MSWKQNQLTDLLEISVPIIQAPMAGASTPEMVIAAGKAGALGSLGVALQTADQINDDVQSIRRSSSTAFNLNFFTHHRPDPNSANNSDVTDHLERWYERLDTGQVVAPAEGSLPFNDATCELMMDVSPKVVSFHFGLPAPALVQNLKNEGIVILSSATSVAEAIWLQDHGADAVIAQGYEAGGHNGWFLDRNGSDVASTMALVPRIVDAIDLPVIAAGGITDGRGIAAAMMLGAQGVQIGTAFLASSECALPEVHKQAVLDATGDDTVHTPAFSGRDARSIVNAYTLDSQKIADWPDFPLMNTATGPLRKASASKDLTDAVSLWAGQAAGLVTDRSGVQDIIERMVKQADALLT